MMPAIDVYENGKSIGSRSLTKELWDKMRVVGGKFHVIVIGGGELAENHLASEPPTAPLSIRTLRGINGNSAVDFTYAVYNIGAVIETTGSFDESVDESVPLHKRPEDQRMYDFFAGKDEW